MKRVALFMLSVIIALAVIPAYAHSGGTDGKGGHFDRSAGEYHYHHGYPAHDHPNGECPYTKKNETTKAEVTTSKPNSSGSVNNKIETKRSYEMVWVVLGFSFIGLLVVLFIILTIADSRDRKGTSVSKELSESENKLVLEMKNGEGFSVPGGRTLGDSIEFDCAIFPLSVYTFFLSAFAYFVVYRVLNVYEFREMAIACACVWGITLLFAIVKRNKMKKIIQSLNDEYNDRHSRLQNAEYNAEYYKKECGKLKEQNHALTDKVYELSRTPSVSSDEYIAKIQEISYKYEVECKTSSSLREDLDSAYAEIRDLKANRVHPDTIAKLENKNSSLSKELALFQDSYFVQKYGILPDNTTQVPYKYCPQCGLKNDDNECVCRECRHDFSEDTYTIRKTSAAVSFVHWMVDKYNTPFQKARRISAKSVVIDHYDANTKTAYIKEDDNTQYMTTHRFCSCPEFQARELPCKHMYALMIQDGVLSADEEENEWR